MSSQRMNTRVVHAGKPDPLIGGAVSTPVFQSSTFAYAGQDSYQSLRYIRLNNTPNHEVLHARLASLENGEAALVAASGMAIISAALLAVLKAGDHVLVQDCLYGGTHALLFQDLTALGIEVDILDGHIPTTWDAKVRPNTRAVYVESVTNPLMEVIDLRAVVALAKRHGLITIIDNTFTSPVNFRPLDLGFDLSLHSATKYLNGHSDIVAGAAIGKRDLMGKVLGKLNHLGGSLDPHACFLLERGMKTLAVRMRVHNDNASRLAHFLDRHPAVERVHYPGLSHHPGHDMAAALFDGFGGMLSFELRGGVAEADRFIAGLHLFTSAPSLGGVESLITRPATTSHSAMTPEDRRKAGVSDRLIRVSVGIEDIDDLIADVEGALAAPSEADQRAAESPAGTGVRGN